MHRTAVGRPRRRLIDVKMQELGKVGRGWKCLEAENRKGHGPGWAVAPLETEQEQVR
jgi:hypothetical protein